MLNMEPFNNLYIAEAHMALDIFFFAFFFVKLPVLGLGLGVDFTFAWNNNNNNKDNNDNDKNPHLNFLKGAVLGGQEQGIRVKG